MSRIKLIKQLKEKNPQLNKSELEVILDTFSKEISKALENGNNVEIRGFGRWYSKKLKENYLVPKTILDYNFLGTILKMLQ